MSSTTHHHQHQIFSASPPLPLGKLFLLTSHTCGHLSSSPPAPRLHHLQATAKPWGFSAPTYLPNLSPFTYLHDLVCKPPSTPVCTIVIASYLVFRLPVSPLMLRSPQSFWINLKCKDSVQPLLLKSFHGQAPSDPSDLSSNVTSSQRPSWGPQYKVGPLHTQPILLSPRASSFPLPHVSQLETIYLGVFLELEYTFKDKDSVSFTTLFTQQLAQCLVLGGHSIFF